MSNCELCNERLLNWIKNAESRFKQSIQLYFLFVHHLKITFEAVFDLEKLFTLHAVLNHKIALECLLYQK